MRSGPWPWRIAAREGFAAARTGRWASALTVVAVAWTVAVVGAAGAVEVSRLVDGEQAWIASGGFVLTASGLSNEDQSTNPVPAAVCDRLAGLDGVGAAFAALRSPQSATLGTAPGGAVSLVLVTPGATAFFDVTDDADGVALITGPLAERTGVTSGEPTRILTGSGRSDSGLRSDLLRARVVDPTMLGEEFAGALLVPSSDVTEADDCYVRTDATHVDAVRDLMVGTLGWDGAPPVVTDRLRTDEFTIDYSDAYQGRTLRGAWVAGAGMLTLLWSALTWSRRSRVAIYATFGMRADSRLVLAVAEWSTLASPGVAWGWAIGIVGALSLGAHPAVALAQVTAQGLLVVLAATVGVIVLGVAPAGSLLSHLKDH